MSLPPLQPDSRKVLVVAEYGVLNGGERSFLAIAPHLVKSGWELIVLLPPDSEFERALHSLDIKTIQLVKHDVDEKRLSQELMRRQLTGHIKATNPAIVHCNSLSTSRLCGPVTRESGVPAIGYLRDIMKLSRTAISDINELDLIIAVSKATRAWHAGQGMASAKIEVVYNGVDLERFSLSENSLHPSVRTELGIGDDDPLLLFVGQIGRRKGVDLLVEVHETISKQNRSCHLLVIGERNSNKDEAIEFEHKVRRSANESAAATRIHWLGRRDDVAAIMREATLLIHPARQEPLGRVLLEAAASGLPMITTCVGGSPEILESLEAFELIQDIDSKAIAKRTMELLSDVEQRGLISRRLRSMAESRYSDKRCAEEIHRRYERLSGRKHVRPGNLV